MTAKKAAKLLSGGIVVGLAAFASGCASHEMVEMAARPGKYRLYSCDELTARGVAVVQREKELREQMDKARRGSGGEIAVAIAYQAEYNQTLGDLRELENTGAQKNCTLKHRSQSDQIVR